MAECEAGEAELTMPWHATCVWHLGLPCLRGQGSCHVCLAAQTAEKEKALQPLTEFMKGVLGDKVQKVAVSSRLSDSPSALVTSKFGWSGQQERIMRNQVGCDPACWVA